MREWLSLARQRPAEALDRLVTVADVQRDRLLARPPMYEFAAYASVVSELMDVFGASMSQFEGELSDVEDRMSSRMTSLTTDAPIAAIHSADLSLARLCYLACRASQPQVVIETGVAYGVTSSFLLAALVANGKGELHSVDLPPLGPAVADHLGVLVDDEHRDVWHLYRGTSRRLLPALFGQLGRIDMFVHDSLHTYRNIRFELDQAERHLAARAVVLADDVDMNRAFPNWVERASPHYSAVVREQSKDSVFGVALFDDDR